MARYSVTYRIDVWGVEHVDADSPEEAADSIKGMDYFELFGEGGLDIDVEDVTEDE